MTPIRTLLFSIAALTTLLAMLIFATGAHAGSYEVRACDSSGINRSFVAVGSSMVAANGSCEAAPLLGMQVRNGLGSGTADPFTWGALEAVAPVGSVITGLRARATAYDQKAGANLDGVDPATLRAEAASALAESDDDGLDAFGGPSFPYVPPDPCTPPKIVRKNGVDLLHDPLYNKGTAFTAHERERLKLRGLLPPRVLSMGSQARRFMLEYKEGRDYVDPNEIEDSGISHESVRKWKALSELKDR